MHKSESRSRASLPQPADSFAKQRRVRFITSLDICINSRMEQGYKEHNALERILDGSWEPQDLPLSLLENVTDNFSDDRIIGEGGFATVYKDVLRNGVVAVKRIRNYHTIEEKLFRQEVNNLMRVNHENIVRFLGFCSNTVHKVIKNEGQEEYIYAEIRERILCFEFINNGSLEKYIADELRGLEWNGRYKIIKGICDGLEYLHVNKHIIHMDLKPGNILLDNHMTVKIADFGLSRKDKDSQTKSAHRPISFEYTAPEYKLSGHMSVKSDVYSLGIIIIELMTGHRGIPDDNNVLRRWRHRWQKSGKERPFEYQQIAKLIEIGIRCQETEPYNRPFISEIIRDVNNLGNMEMQISNAHQSTAGQISPYLEDDMLGIEPLELYFPFELSKCITCTLELTNKTDSCIAFGIQTTSPLPYCTQPSKGIMQPQSKRGVNITLQPLDNAPQVKQYINGFIVRSTKVKESLTDEDINEVLFSRLEGKVVDEVTLTVAFGNEVPKVGMSLESLTLSGTRNVNSSEESNVPPGEAQYEAEVPNVTLTVAYEAEVPKVGLSLESLTISGTRNLNSSEESNVPPAEVESTRSLCSPDELIQFDPQTSFSDKFTYRESSSAIREFSDTQKLGQGAFGVVYKWMHGKSYRRDMGHVREFTYRELSSATRDFSDTRKIGQGAFGVVYRGTVMLQDEDGRKRMLKEVDVAIKKNINPVTVESRAAFKNEVDIMKPLNHVNIIRLVGWCDSRKSLMLVYELVENRNLEDRLYGSRSVLFLDWRQRYNILVGVACGLEYLHNCCGKTVLHMDIKPANVMLDRDFNAKLCDFGLVTQLSQAVTSRFTNAIIGTQCYMDPSFMETGMITRECDIYSFGVLLLEVVCGVKPDLIRNGRDTKKSLIEMVLEYQKNGEILGAADKHLRGNFDEQIKGALCIGLHCVKPNRGDCPSIVAVLSSLRSLHETYAII